MPNFFTVSIVAEVICFIISVVCLAKARSVVWRSMIWYLLITCVVEILGLYISKQTQNNHWLYNIFLFFEAGFTFVMLGYLLGKYKNSKPGYYYGFAVFLIVYAYGLITKGFLVYNYTAYTVISVMFVLYSLYYYYLLLKSDSYIVLRFSPEFWWVAGTLLFYFANTGCNIFYSKLYQIMITPKHHLTYFIFKALNIILYGCWSYAFICKKWLTTISEA